MRSAFAPVAVALAAVIASLARWQLQGSRNFYTTLEKDFYVKGAVVDWELGDHDRLWLGLEVIGILVGIAVGLAVGGWIIRRREAKTGRRATLLRAASWVAAVAPFAVPIAAFASGGRPAGGFDLNPAMAAATAADAPAPGSGSGTGSGSATGPAITGALDLPAGRYELVPHKSSAITARLKAGGDSFDARFTGGLAGEWRADPRDLTQPMTAEISAEAASVDTGIEQRSKHAREGYLKAAEFPRIGWKLERLVSARQESPERISFRAAGSVSLMGRTHAVEATGTLEKAGPAALASLGMEGAQVLIAQAQLSLVIKETALAPDAGDFDGDRIPIHVSLVLRHAGER